MYENFEKIMDIMLLVAWCGGVACAAENKEERRDMKSVVVKENISPRFFSPSPRLPTPLLPPFLLFLK